MFASRKTPFSFDQLRREILSRANRLLLRELAPIEAVEQIAVIEDLIQSLPLATGEYATFKCRLGSARGYFEADERGAARFELRLLASSIARDCSA